MKRHTCLPAFAIVWVALVTIAAGAAADTSTRAESAARPAVVSPREIDLLLCLDTSGSMSGLIDAARQKLWVIVNDLATARPTPDLRVALLTYGNDGHNAEDGWVAVETDFTTDLDHVSDRLFALTTNGGTEYVGRVLDYAKQLTWSASKGALQIAIVAGNESADQDPNVSFRDACHDLIARGIMVNSIYCGPAEDAVAPSWREVAMLADGKFATIDQNHGTVVIETPFDKKLAELGTRLNGTFVAYGAKGEAGALNQSLQDSNARSLSPAAEATRAQAKASQLYRQSWDLVGAVNDGEVALEEVADADLPETMQKMNLAERQAFIDEMTKRRESLQNQINDLAARRDAHVQAEIKRRALDESSAFDHALRGAVREQARLKGFVFEDGPVGPDHASDQS